VVQVHQGKLNFTTMSDIPEGASVLTGTFSINDTPVKILFDSGATHSFISENLLGKLGLMVSQTKSAYKIITPGGNISSHTLAFGVSDVFPDELLGMPPDRDVEFVIELQPGTAPIYDLIVCLPRNYLN
jgi:hypothetical protein